MFCCTLPPPRGSVVLYTFFSDFQCCVVHYFRSVLCCTFFGVHCCVVYFVLAYSVVLYTFSACSVVMDGMYECIHTWDQLPGCSR